MKCSVASCLLATLISSILVVAIPIPVVPGQVVQRKVSIVRNFFLKKKSILIMIFLFSFFFFLQNRGGATSSSSTEHYQGVVLDTANANGHHQIAQVAARLDKATYPYQAPASDYHPEFKAGHVIDTGKPATLHGSEIEASHKITTPMTDDKLAKLKSNISVYSLLCLFFDNMKAKKRIC